MAREFGYRDIAAVEIEHDGVARTLQEWAGVLNIPYPTVRMRYRRGKRTFNELFRATGLSGVTVYTKEEGGNVTVTHQSRTVLDDLFGPETANKVREVAKQANLAPIEVVQKLVVREVNRLLAQTQQTN